jgi:hypothetical protein
MLDCYFRTAQFNDFSNPGETSLSGADVMAESLLSLGLTAKQANLTFKRKKISRERNGTGGLMLKPV